MSLRWRRPVFSDEHFVGSWCTSWGGAASFLTTWRHDPDWTVESLVVTGSPSAWWPHSRPVTRSIASSAFCHTESVPKGFKLAPRRPVDQMYSHVQNVAHSISRGQFELRQGLTRSVQRRPWIHWLLSGNTISSSSKWSSRCSSRCSWRWRSLWGCSQTWRRRCAGSPPADSWNLHLYWENLNHFSSWWSMSMWMYGRWWWVELTAWSCTGRLALGPQSQRPPCSRTLWHTCSMSRVRTCWRHRRQRHSRYFRPVLCFILDGVPQALLLAYVDQRRCCNMP